MIAVSAGMLVIAAILLFTRLGHYALWDDEALDALSAKAIRLTGDTTAMIGQNLIAYRGGILLKGLRHQGMPPLPGYTAALGISLGGETAFGARWAFALCGLLTVALLLRFLMRRAEPRFFLLFCAAMVGNVSLWLFLRQCHYYALTILFTTAAALLVLGIPDTRRKQCAFAALLCLLLAANSIIYVAFMGCLAVDYWLWQRKTSPLDRTAWLLLLVPQLLVGLVFIFLWNPLATRFGAYLGQNSLANRLTILWWNLRDLNRCEFGAGVLLLAAPFVGLARRNVLLIRGTVAFLIFIVVESALSPQTVKFASVADVRVLAPLIPLAAALGTGVLHELPRHWRLRIAPIAAFAFFTNFPNGGPMLPSGTRSTFASFIGELMHPPDDPYTPVAKWINEHMRTGESVWVMPDYMAYPLMFHAPDALYAWQLKPPAAPQFSHLPPIHFAGLVAPDYVIAFGPVVRQIVPIISSWDRIRYERVVAIDHFWKDMHRPELFWRTFTPITNFDRASESIYIFQRVEPLVAAAPTQRASALQISRISGGPR